MSLRDDIIDQANWGVRNSAEIHYAQSRPIPLKTYKEHRLPISTDCSGYATCCYYAAGAPDPNGLGYSGQGFTGSLIGHLPEIAHHEAEAGDLVVFGPGDGDHTVILLDNGNVPDPRVFSHGTEDDPKIQPLSIEVQSHPPPTRFLRGVPPQKVGPVNTWNVVNGSGEVIGAKIKHPVRWALRHPRSFRKNWSVIFKRLSDPWPKNSIPAGSTSGSTSASSNSPSTSLSGRASACSTPKKRRTMPKVDYTELAKRVVRTAVMAFIGVYGGANLVNALGGSAAFNVSLARSAGAAALVAVVSLLWGMFLDPSPIPSMTLKGSFKDGDA